MLFQKMKAGCFNMSGYKLATISITSEEFDRLYEAENEIKDLPDTPAEWNDFVGTQSVEIIQTNLDNLQTRQEAFTSSLSDVNENIQSMERNTSQALIDFETEVTARVEQYAGSMWDHFDQVITETNHQFDQQIRGFVEETQDELANIYWNLNKMTSDTDSKRILAEEWLYAAELYCDFIKQFYPYEQFTPGRVEWLERQLDQTRQNLAIGLSETTIATSQQVYMAFSDLRVELERLYNEWGFLCQAAWEEITRLQVQINECQNIQAVDMEGNLIDQQIDLVYWSEGALVDLFDRVNTVREAMGNANQPPDREELRRWLEVDIPGFWKELEEIVVSGRINVLNSQLRINLADLVVQALQEQGFILDQAEYIDQDMRTAYGAHMLNPEGNQVFVQIAPVGKRLGENKLHLQSMDSEVRTEHELERRWYEISRSLRDYGVEVGQYTRMDKGTRRNVSQPDSRMKSDHSRKKAGHGYRTGPSDNQGG
jgi:hypothetical protein